MKENDDFSLDCSRKLTEEIIIKADLSFSVSAK